MTWQTRTCSCVMLETDYTCTAGPQDESETSPCTISCVCDPIGHRRDPAEPVVIATNLSPIYVFAETKGRHRIPKQRNCCRESHRRAYRSWRSPTPNNVPVRPILLKTISVIKVYDKEPMDCATLLQFNFTLLVLGSGNPHEWKPFLTHLTSMRTIGIAEVTRKPMQRHVDPCTRVAREPEVSFSHPTYSNSGLRLQAEYTLKGGRNVQALRVPYPCQILCPWDMEKEDTV